MKYRIIVKALLIIYLVVPGLIFAQQPKLKFRHITREAGISNSTIECIYQDRRGFIWFGTRDGLDRYDGNQITVYQYNSKDTTSISDNYIRSICEDKEHNLWIGTTNGLNRYNPSKDNFVRYKHYPDQPGSLSNSLITCILSDHRGNLWVSTFGGGLNLFQPGQNRFAHYGLTGSTAPIHDSINCLFEDSRGRLWIGSQNGLQIFIPENGAFYNFPIEINGRDKRNWSVTVIKEDHDKNLLIGTEENGLLLLDLFKNKFLQYQHNDRIANSLGSNLVRSILTDTKGNVWVGTINGGLNLLNKKGNLFSQFQNEPSDPFSLSQRTVSSLFEDNQGNLWVGTHRGGVNLFAPKTEKFTLYCQQPDPQSLSYNDVKAFCEDHQGNIWIGTDGGGLNRFDKEKKVFRHYKYDPFNPKSIGSNEVLAITEDSEQNLWVGTWGGGLSVFNKQNGSFTRISAESLPASSFIQQVFEDHSKNLWIATYYGGLYLLDRATKKFRRITEDSAHQTRLHGNNIVSLAEDKKGNLWVGTDDGGLNCYNRSAGVFTHYFDTGEKMPDLRVLFVDSKGRLWVGQTGLYLFDSSKNKFSIYTEKGGLSTEFIKGMTEDAEGTFWISTSNGITRFNPDNFQFKKYNTADGLQGLEFEANAYLKSKDGEMFFGGLNGFNCFYPTDIKPNAFIPPVVITDFQIFGDRIIPNEKGSPLQIDISLTKQIKLDYNQSTFTFSFAALNFTAPENNQYAYKLDRWDKQWVYAGNEHKANYTNLSPGKYTFCVKASNNDGIWNEKATCIEIVITPPFWATWWFRLILVLVIGAVIISYYQFRRRMERRKLEDKKKEEMHQMQLQFFTNISHEFRTPLSLIIGPLEKIQKENSLSGFSHYYRVMERNAKRLMYLINELMDFRKTESGALKLNVMPGNIQAFIDEIAEEFNEVAIQREIDFSVVLSAELENPWFDRQILEKIVVNLLSNSFKYSTHYGKIKVEILTSLKDHNPSFQNELMVTSDYNGKNYLFVSVKDNGVGISKDSIAHLFERYYRVADTHLGSGIGLAFVKSLTFLHKGQIYVYSEPGIGTEIIIGIPVSKDDYNSEERWTKKTERGNTLGNVLSLDPDLEPESEDEQSKISKGHPSEREHILIVEDNDDLREFLKGSLETYYHITDATNGQDGIVISKEILPDLIISDVMMPKMDGIEFCRRIKEDAETSHIPFLMLTAKDSPESKLTGVVSGADFYFAKPVSIDLLQATIKNIFLQRLKIKDRYINDHFAELKQQVHSTRDMEFIEELIAVIEAQLSNSEMNIDFICTQIGMSRSKLYQKLKNITGQSIGDFVRNVRLEKAAYMMTSQDISLSEVMFHVGIQTQSYFTKAFKKKFGKTPSQYLRDLDKKSNYISGENQETEEER